MKAILITSLNDAEYYIGKSYMYKDYIPCTNLTSVHALIKKEADIECIDLNIFLTEKIIKKNFNNDTLRYLKFLKKLDKNYSQKINKKIKIKKIDWFFALYRYQTLLSYIGINQLFSVLNKFFKKSKIKEIFIFNKLYVSQNIIKEEDYIFFLKFFCKKNKIKFNYIKTNSIERNDQKINFGFFIKFLRILKKQYKHTVNKINFLIRVKNSDPNSIIIAPIWDLNFYKNKIGNGLIFDIEDKNKNKTSKTNYIVKKNLRIEDFILKRLHEIFLDHLNENLSSFKVSLKKIKKIIYKFDIKKFYWGMPPTQPNARSIITNYLVNNDYDVIGIQHGGSYGTIIDDSLHTLSDYTFCKTFLAYGKFYLQLNKKFKSLKFKICNFKIIGSPKINNFIINDNIYNKKLLPQKKVLFPINLCHHILEPKINLNGHLMFNIQKEILNYLNKFNKKSIVKLYQKNNYDFIQNLYPCKIIIDNYKNLNIQNKNNFSDSMRRLKPSLVILDQFSTPLYEIIYSECEIICFLNPLCNIKKIHYQSLKKRVHFVRNIEEFKIKMNEYNTGSLKLKYNSNYIDKILLKSSKIN